MVGFFVRAMWVNSLKNATDKIKEIKKGMKQPDANDYNFYGNHGFNVVPFAQLYSKDKKMDVREYVANVMTNGLDPIRLVGPEFYYIKLQINEDLWRELARYCNDMADFIKYSEQSEKDIQELEKIQRELKKKLGISEEEE